MIKNKLIIFLYLSLISMLNANPDEKIVLIEELPCEKKITLNSEVDQSIEDKDFTKLLLEDNDICEASSSSSSSSKPSSNLKQTKQIEDQKTNNLNNQQNNSENLDGSDTNNLGQNSYSSTDLSLSRCKQNLNLVSEVEEALLEEIQNEQDERKKQGLVKFLADVSGIDVDKIEEECFNN